MAGPRLGVEGTVAWPATGHSNVFSKRVGWVTGWDPCQESRTRTHMVPLGVQEPGLLPVLSTTSECYSSLGDQLRCPATWLSSALSVRTAQWLGLHHCSSGSHALCSGIVRGGTGQHTEIWGSLGSLGSSRLCRWPESSLCTLQWSCRWAGTPEGHSFLKLGQS